MNLRIAILGTRGIPNYYSGIDVYEAFIMESHFNLKHAQLV